MILIYIHALIELTLFNPSILDVKDFKSNYYYRPRAYYSESRNYNFCKNNPIWLTKVYNWGIVEDSDFCAYDMVTNEVFY